MFMDKLAKALLACCGIFFGDWGYLFSCFCEVKERQSWHNDIAID
ncbi:hypothetical protein ACUIJ5_20335 [Bacillus toyonensis]